MRRALLLLPIAAISCVFQDVTAVEDAVPIEVIERPADLDTAERFGIVLDGYAGALASDVAISRVVTSGGSGTGHAVIGVWTGANVAPREALFDGCEDPTSCDPGSGTDVIGLPEWNGQRDCVLTSSAADRTLRIQCESESAMILRLAVPATAGFGTALAALPADNGAGVAIVGAPESGLPAEAGELWKLVSGEVSAVQLTVRGDSGIGPGAELGAAVAAAELPGGDVLVAAAAPGASRVVAFRLPADPTETTLETLGCVDAAVVRSPGADLELGGSLAVGDVDGDGAPELIVGDPAGNRVSIVSGASLSGGVGCEDPSTADDPAAVVIACDSVAATNVESCGAFGAAVEVGDVNADGVGDLIVGAPRSTVNGDVDAGAIYTIPGGAGGLDADAGRGLGPSQTTEGMRLGEALTTAPSQLTGTVRDEVIAGAPGDARLYLFWCTGVAGDDAAEGRDRCLDP